MLVKMQLRWEGHITRIEDRRLSKILLYGDLSSGKGDVGGDEKKFKDSFRNYIHTCDINPLKKQLRTNLGKKRQNKEQPNHQKNRHLPAATMA